MEEMLHSTTALALVSAGCLLIWAGPTNAQDSDGFGQARGTASNDHASKSPGQPAMFQASFIMHAFGNDTTTGASSPFNAYVFTAMPLGRSCQSTTPTSGNGSPNPHYCSPAILQQGKSATGSGTLGVGSGALATVALPYSAFGIATTGFLPVYYHYAFQSHTYATFANVAGRFFTGGGPAAGFGQQVKTGMGQTTGTWIINEGKNGFGGALGLLGKLGASVKYPLAGKVGTYEGKGSWAMIPQLGRQPYATPIGWDKQGKTTAWQNPYQITNSYINNQNGNISSLQLRGSGTPWTTGSVTVYALAGYFQTILHRGGHDTNTTGGARNIQLVTPALTHWIGPGYQTHTGHIGILTLLVPEPARAALLAAGLCALLALQCWSRQRRA